MAKDGSVLIADDVANAGWRVASTTGATALIGVRPSFSTVGQSHVMLFYGEATAATATLLVRDGGSGRVLGSWTSPSLPPGSSRQFSAAEIESGAGAVQHVIWNAASGTLENFSRCDVPPSSDLKTLINVHSTRLADYPSQIRIYNAGAVAAAARLTGSDAATGGAVWHWTSPAIDVGAMLEVTMATVEAAATPANFSAPNHYVLTLDPGYSGVLQHIVVGPSGLASDLSDRCALAR